MEERLTSAPACFAIAVVWSLNTRGQAPRCRHGDPERGSLAGPAWRRSAPCASTAASPVSPATRTASNYSSRPLLGSGGQEVAPAATRFGEAHDGRDGVGNVSKDRVLHFSPALAAYRQSREIDSSSLKTMGPTKRRVEPSSVTRIRRPKGTSAWAGTSNRPPRSWWPRCRPGASPPPPPLPPWPPRRPWRCRTAASLESCARPRAEHPPVREVTGEVTSNGQDAGDPGDKPIRM